MSGVSGRIAVPSERETTAILSHLDNHEEQGPLQLKHELVFLSSEAGFEEVTSFQAWLQRLFPRERKNVRVPTRKIFPIGVAHCLRCPLNLLKLRDEESMLARYLSAGGNCCFMAVFIPMTGDLLEGCFSPLSSFPEVKTPRANATTDLFGKQRGATPREAICL
ncbi:hypothetical protein C8Q75DRAFT_737875 [Abortiporus biennis]|nr:hypothetical protein C8Q75DRAFT_737875 [Abortiporus biennis]